MEAIIKALVEEGVTADQFLAFVTDYGIQEDPYLQEVLNQLVAKETTPGSPQTWTSSEADDLLALLKSPEKTQERVPLKEINRNVQASNDQINAADFHFECNQCHKSFTKKRNLLQHVNASHKNITYLCSKCQYTFTRQTNLRQHEKICKGINTFPCDKCTEILKTSRELEFHQKLKHKITQKRPVREKKAAPTSKQSRQPGPSTYNCRQCEAKFQHIMPDSTDLGELVPGLHARDQVPTNVTIAQLSFQIDPHYTAIKPRPITKWVPAYTQSLFKRAKNPGLMRMGLSTKGSGTVTGSTEP